MEKNIAGQKFKVFAFTTATGMALTGDAAQITGKISIDGAALAAITDINPTELESGYYEFDATQAETNGKEILVIPVSSTSGVSVVGVPALIKTDSPNMSDLGIESDGDLTKVNTCDINTDMVDISALALDSKSDTIITNLADVPTNAEFEARTKLTAEYFDPDVKEVETGYSWTRAFRRLLSFAGGNTTNSGKSFWSIVGDKIRLVFTTDASNNRTISSEDLD